MKSRTFEPASLHDLRTPEEAVRKPFTDLAWSLGIARGAVGYEPGGASEAGPLRGHASLRDADRRTCCAKRFRPPGWSRPATD